MTFVPPSGLGRRRFLRAAAGGLSTLAVSRIAGFEPPTARASADPANPAPPVPTPRAKRAIWLFMAGGPSSLDLFDYKPRLVDLYNQDLPESVRGDQRLTGMTANQTRFPIVPSLFQFAQSGASGAWVSELLPYTRQIVDDIAIVKTMHTDSINHDPGMLEVNTGSEQPGKPSLGAWLSYALGPINPDLPGYVVMTSRLSTTDNMVQPLSSRLWGSAFLPERHGAVPIRGAGEPVLYLANPAGVDAAVRHTTIETIRGMNDLLSRDLG